MSKRSRARAEKRSGIVEEPPERGRSKAPIDAGKMPLQSGESVVIVARQSRLMRLPKYIFTLGLYGLWRKRNTVVVTDRRILMGRGIFNRSEYSVPMSRVYNASFARKGLASYSEVTIETREGRRLLRVGPLTSRTARRFTSEVQSRN